MLKKSSRSVKETPNEHLKLKSIARGVLFSYIITIPSFIIFAFILRYVDFPETLISPVVIITTIISVLAAGLTVSRGMKTRGWLNGGIVGLIYMIILYILSSIIYKNFTIDRYVITMAVIGILTGTIGGVMGINLKKPSFMKTRR